MAPKRPKPEAKTARRAELRARLAKQNADLRAVNRKLEALGPEYPSPADLLGTILGGQAERSGVSYAVTGRLVG